MASKLPTPIPQVPVRDLARAIEFYQLRLGFLLDWKCEDGIAGVSREKTRLFLDRVAEGALHPVRIWLNLDSVAAGQTHQDSWGECRLGNRWKRLGISQASRHTGLKPRC
jgi:catechol 2,3-dioxygenase-like lactoylglutathione lyase family enzyme